MNVKLLRKIQKHILANPKELDMRVIAQRIEGKTARKIFKPGYACGTAACIDGLAQLYSGRLTPDLRGNLVIGHDNNFEIGRSILGLDFEQGERLFSDPTQGPSDNEGSWPNELAAVYTRAFENGDFKSAAQIAAARIEVFILTNGAM